jgi:hypothetical protein
MDLRRSADDNMVRCKRVFQRLAHFV